MKVGSYLRITPTPRSRGSSDTPARLGFQVLSTRSVNACALAELVRVPLEPQPIVMEHFVLARTPLDVYEAADLYPAMASWGAHQNASTLHFERHSDVPRGQFQKRCGGFRQKSFPFIHLGSLE